MYLNYVVELEEGLVDDANNFIVNSESKMNKTNNQSFSIGDEIIHEGFGHGIIKEIDKDTSSYVIKVFNLSLLCFSK